MEQIVSSTLQEQLCGDDMIFAVHNDVCNILKVTVVEAHKITKGWVRDLVDKPDPYVILYIPGSPNGKKKTKYFDNTASPTWNEEFTFILDPEKSYELELTLMDANYTVDRKLGVEKISLTDLNFNEETPLTVKFNEVTEIILKLLLEVDDNPDLRYGLSLCNKEKDFRKKRRHVVKQSLQSFFPENASLKDSEVPVIGVIGSGGGFRAMTALSGAMKALADTKLLDCATYVAGLSGSAWYLSTLYSHPDFPSKKPGDLLDELKTSVRHSPFWLLSPRSMYRYISDIKQKHKNGQPVSFTDFFGHLLGDTLLKGRQQVRLSDQREKIDHGEAPLPLYTCLHVKNNVSAKVFQDWIEFTPYEIGISKYAAFMKTEGFGSKFFKARIVKRFAEFPLHYLQGIWGSAFTILFRRLLQEKTKLSIDLNALPVFDSDEEDDIFFDAEEDFQDEEEALRDALGNIDLSAGGIDDIQSENEDEEGPLEDSPKMMFWSTVRNYFASKQLKTSSSLASILVQKSKANYLESSCANEVDESKRKQSVWKDFVNNICTNSILDTRKGRAGCILNPLRGLSLIPCFSFSPFSPTSPSDDMLFKGLTEAAPTDSKTLYLVDGGLTFNLPFPLLLRPQRSVDLFITFDFSSREADHTAPFKELLLSEKWAQINNCPFPPIHDLVSEYIKHPPKECYVFKHPTNELCPIIIYFPLVNLDFKKFKQPGVPRETEEELEFANFGIFSDCKKAYSIYNFKYPSKKFDRLSQLMEFNVLNNIEIIKENLLVVMERKRKFMAPESLVLNETCEKK